MCTVSKVFISISAFVLFSTELASSKLPDGFIEERIVTGLDPTAMRIAPDGRLFITEKNGRVRIVENGEFQPRLTPSVGNRHSGVPKRAHHPEGLYILRV